MTTFVSALNGGKTGPEGSFRFLGKIAQNNDGVIGVDDLKVVENHLGADDSVDIGVGDVIVPISDQYVVPAWQDLLTNLPIDPNTSGSTRIDAIVAWVDESAFTPASENNPGALKFMDVNGTPAGPAPTDSDIDSAVGSTNWQRLANVTLVDGFTNISNADIEDTRKRIAFGNTTSIRPFTVAGSLSVANDVDFHSIVPQGVEQINRLDACVKVAPVGDDIILRCYNITQAQEVGTVTIADGSLQGFNNAPTNPDVNAGDILRFDVLQVGSGTAGEDAMLQPSI